MSKKPRSKFSIISLFLISLFILLFLLLSQPLTGRASQGVVYKVIAAKNVIAETRQDIVLWHDYGSFALYRVSEEAWSELPTEVRAQLEIIDDIDQLSLGDKTVNIFEDSRQQVEADEIIQGERLHLIQFVGPIKDVWLDEVMRTETELVHYIANFGYLVWTDADGRHELDRLAEEGTFLQASAPYLSSFKLGPTLGADQAANEVDDNLVAVTVQLYRHGNVGKSEAIIKKLFVDGSSPWEFVLNYQNISGTIHEHDIAVIAELPDVVWIGEDFPREMNDEVQGQIMANNLASGQNKPVGPGYLPWLFALGLGNNPDKYPIVDITDDGIGNGIAAAAGGDVTLRQMGSTAKPSRLAYIANCTSAPNGASPDGHGHINVSIAGGYDERSGFPFQDEDGYQLGLGINPYGRFAGTRVFDEDFNTEGCGGTDSSLIQETYNRGARIVSNSWGCGGCAGVYDTASQAYDAGVRDANSETAGNQELFIVFSAGNGGPDVDTIGSPGNGKNMITVGASENVRPTWTDGCGIGPNEADLVQDIASFSSRGPAPGKRVKPDVVAPGSHVQGTASTAPAYNGSGVCDPYHPGEQNVFAASSGTSHSAPAVAGLASLVYAYLQQHYELALPSPALMKGYIIAHTMYLNGSGAGGSLPSNNQGFGLPNMKAAFNDVPRVILDQTDVPLFTESGEAWSLTVAAADRTKPVRIVMTYTDQPGPTGREPQVNDLDLSVGADGKSYLGNHMAGQWSTPGGTADRVNNVEAVFLPSLNDSSVRINVTAINIAGDGVPGVGDMTDQDFTIVCSNCIEQKDFTMNVRPAKNSICRPGKVGYDLLLESILGFSEPVTLSAVNLPAGITGQFSRNPVVPTGNSVLTLDAEETTAAGTYTIAVGGSGGDRQHSVNVKLDVYSQSPSSPELVTPPDGASEQPLTETFTWMGVAQAATYEIQIALDADFTRIVEEKSGLTNNRYTATKLLPSQYYHWRVRAVNSCGGGGYSTANSFSTKQLPGGCPIGVTPEIIYRTNFEGSIAGWTHDGANDNWQLSEARSHSKTKSFHAPDLDTVSDQKLISPEIKLPAKIGPLTLQFWNYQALESNELEQDVCFDGAILEVSTNNGLSWRQIGGSPHDNRVLVTDPYDGIVDSAHDNPLGGNPAWCGDPQDWINSVVRIDEFAGDRVRFRFRLGTDKSIGDEGWYIDDVLVQYCQVDISEIYLPMVSSLTPSS